MQTWAITGGIACGKSTVSKLFAECGAKIASADDDARAVLAEGEPTRAVVLEAFGTIDRTELAAKIFGDPEARKRLNSIMHPAIRQRMRTAIDAVKRTLIQLRAYCSTKSRYFMRAGWRPGSRAWLPSPRVARPSLVASKSAASAMLPPSSALLRSLTRKRKLAAPTLLSAQTPHLRKPVQQCRQSTEKSSWSLQ